MIHIIAAEIPLIQSYDSLKVQLTKLMTPWFTYTSMHAGHLPFFNHWLLVPGATPSGSYLNGIRSGFQPVSSVEWKQWHGALLGGGKGLPWLHTIAAKYGNMPLTFWVMVPYPIIENGKHRLQSVVSWSDTFLRLWHKHFAAAGHTLAGFVWGRECIPESDRDLALAYNTWVERHGYRSMWLPNYGAAYVNEWRELGFHETALYSNFTGKGPYDVSWVTNSMLTALTNKMGWQSVYGTGFLFQDGYEQAYFDAIAHYEKVGSLGPIVHRTVGQTANEIVAQKRSVYDGIYSCVHKGSV